MSFLLRPSSRLLKVLTPLTFIPDPRQKPDPPAAATAAMATDRPATAPAAEDDGKVSQEVLDYLESGFKKLQDDDGCHSLLKKYLTRETLDELRDKTTPKFGSTLKDVVQSGE